MPLCVAHTDIRYGDTHGNIRRVCGDAVADNCKPIWGLDKVGELNGVWRDIGVRGLWCILGLIVLGHNGRFA